MLVDGVLTSCYASIDHDLAHITMTPLRWFPEIMKYIFGDDIGFPVYVLINKSLVNQFYDMGHTLGKIIN